MPFVQLQHSKNVTLTDAEYHALFKKMYDAAYSVLGGIKGFKASVTISHYSFVILHGNESDSFVFLKVFLLKKANRTSEIKEQLGQAFLAILEKAFAEKLRTLNIHFSPSVEISDVTALFKNESE